jgi:hypothetical protein
MLCNIPEEQIYHLHHGGSLKHVNIHTNKDTIGAYKMKASITFLRQQQKFAYILEIKTHKLNKQNLKNQLN